MTIALGSVVVWSAAPGTYGLNTFTGGEQCPAFIAAMEGGTSPNRTVDLIVFGSQGYFYQSSVPEDDSGVTPGSWSPTAGGLT